MLRSATSARRSAATNPACYAVSRSHPRSSRTTRAVITSVRLTPVFRSESTRGAVSVAFRDGPERIADPRWLAVDIVPEHANHCTTQSARLARASSQ
jgi:hypothetical protein